MQITFSGDQLRDLRGPIVYVAEREGIVTYVGMSAIGVGRAFRKDGHLHERNKALAEADKLTITACNSVDEAVNSEADLIHAHHPAANRRCDRCSQPEILRRKLTHYARIVKSRGRQNAILERKSSITTGKRIKILRNVIIHMVSEHDDQFAIQEVINLF